MSGRFRFALALGVLVLGTSCGDDSTKVDADVEVRIERARFFPNEVSISPGAKVRWVNVLPRSAENERTVTSGTKDDPDAGSLFDVTLKGYASGEPEGETFVFEFDEPAVYHYFSRLPTGEEFTGTVTVH